MAAARLTVDEASTKGKLLELCCERSSFVAIDGMQDMYLWARTHQHHDMSQVCSCSSLGATHPGWPQLKLFVSCLYSISLRDAGFLHPITRMRVTTISSGSQTTQVSRPHAGSRQPTRGIATRRHRPTIARGPQPPMGMWVFAPRSPAIHLPRSIRSAPVRTQPPSRSHSRPPQIHPDLGLGTGRVRVPATNRCPQRQPSQLRPGRGWPSR
jgi:hypothetical protein